MAPFPETYVGGTEAETIDERDAAARDRQLLIPLILGLVVVALVLLLRSVVAPLILVASVVGTYFAALGASWWLFTGVFGFERLKPVAHLALLTSLCFMVFVPMPLLLHLGQTAFELTTR